MPFPILGSNSAVAEFAIDNSLRFNKADSAKLSFTQGTPTSRRTWTYSTWVKRGNLADQQESILSWGDEDFFDVRFQDGTPDDGLMVYISDTDSKSLATNRVFRDPSAWYHIVIASDTTQSTAGDRTRIYVNGVEETSFASEAQPDQNYDYRGLVSGDPIVIGNRYTGSHYFDGYLAETHFIDGQQLTPSEFGETNDNGVWIPKEYEGTYGTNGFYLKFADSSNLGDDTSGNTNDFTATNLNANYQTTDTPTNNFCTANPLQRGFPPSYLITLKEGNLQAQETSSNWIPYDSTIGVQNGKWYWECENVSGSPAAGFMFGIQAQEGGDITGLFTTDNRYPGYYSGRVGFSYHASGTYYYNGASTTTGSVSYTNGDTIMLALDMDNGFLYVGKNGSWNNSGDPTSGSSGTGNVYNGFSAKTITPCNALNGSSVKAYLNFGNPVVANDSSNSDGNGYGDFEYAVPSGYYALCTKNLAEYG